jgi:hypothetical protein
MKKTFAVLMFLLMSSSANACTVASFTSSPEVIKSRGRMFEFKNYTAICERLKAANAGLLITGDAGVLEGNSIAWAAVSIVDKNGGIFSNTGSGSSTHLGHQGTMNEAQSLLGQVIDESVDRMNIELAIAALDRTRAQVKSAKR